MSYKIIAPLLGLLVVGCATVGQNNTEKARLAFEASLADCRQQYPDRLAKPVTPRVACLQDASTAYQERLAARDSNIPIQAQRIRAAKIKSLARQYDSGAITREEYVGGAQQADAEFNRLAGA